MSSYASRRRGTDQIHVHRVFYVDFDRMRAACIRVSALISGVAAFKPARIRRNLKVLKTYRVFFIAFDF